MLAILKCWVIIFLGLVFDDGSVFISLDHIVEPILMLFESICIIAQLIPHCFYNFYNFYSSKLYFLPIQIIVNLNW